MRAGNGLSGRQRADSTASADLARGSQSGQLDKAGVQSTAPVIAAQAQTAMDKLNARSSTDDSATKLRDERRLLVPRQ